MLLNLSNHPSSAWSPEQLRAATEQFGGVIDVPFPNIDPKATSEEITELGDSFVDDITKIWTSMNTVPFEKTAHDVYKLKNRDDIIRFSLHIMGEMTFVHYLIKEIVYFGIKCYASTTERTVLEEADGRKTVQFKFVQFRQYY